MLCAAVATRQTFLFPPPSPPTSPLQPTLKHSAIDSRSFILGQRQLPRTFVAEHLSTVSSHSFRSPVGQVLDKRQRASLPAELFMRDANLPSFFFDDVLDGIRLVDLASLRSIESQMEYHRSRFKIDRFIHRPETDMQAIIATRKLDDGRISVMIAIPGVKSTRNVRSVRKLRLVPARKVLFDIGQRVGQLNSDSSDDEGELDDERPNSLMDRSSWWIDLPNWKHQPSDEPHIPKGFAETFLSIRDDVVTAISDLIQMHSLSSIESISFVGHSLGGVMAVYASMSMSRFFENVVENHNHRPSFRIVSIGSPKMGDLTFSQEMAREFKWMTAEDVLQSKDVAVHFALADDPIVNGNVAGIPIMRSCIYKPPPGHHVVLPIRNPWLDPTLHHRQFLYELEFKNWAHHLLHPVSQALPTLHEWCRAVSHQHRTNMMTNMNDILERCSFSSLFNRAQRS